MLHTAAQVRAIEERLARDHDLPASTLMDRAGDALLRCVRTNWPESRRIVVIAGSGNNGGDGYALAQRLARIAAIDVSIVALAEARASEARLQVEGWRSMGRAVRDWQPGEELPTADLLVDALFGIGLSRPLGADALALIAAINRHEAPVLSVDVPSGLQADTGSDAGSLVRATRTLCLLARKRGLHTGRALDAAGTIAFDDLGANALVDATAGRLSTRAHDESSTREPEPATPEHDTTSCGLLDARDLRRWLPPRRRGAHKGDHGHVLVIGGDSGMVGAARIAGHAALRSGAGRVSIATRDAHAGLLGLAHPELMTHGVEDAGALGPLLARVDALAIGPGLGQGGWARTLLDAALAISLPTVLDADALNLLAQSPHRLGANIVLTPHPGEAARLLDTSIAAIERDRFASARELSTRFGCIVVLKGAGTIVDDGRQCVVCPYGNPGMASGGMGDALTGIIVAFMAQRLDTWDAAVAGVLAHALAGDVAALAGERGLTASDLIDALHTVVNP